MRPSNWRSPEPGDLAAAAANDALVRIVGHDEVAGAEGLDRNLRNLRRLGTRPALDHLLHYRACGLARLVLPVVVAAAEHQALFGPNDLRPDGEAASLEALGDGRRMQRAMPDVGDFAGEERPGLAPVGAVVIQHLAGAAGARGTCLVPPRRIVLDPIRRIADHQQRGHVAEHTLDVGRDRGVAAEQPVRPEQPEIARPADRVRGGLRDLVLAFAGISRRRRAGQAAGSARCRRSR